MVYMVKMLTQTPAKDAENATAALNQFEKSIRAHEERGARYKLEEVVKIARLKMIMPVKIKEFVALRTPSECS